VIPLFVLLLIVFLGAFLGLDVFTGGDPGGDIYVATVQNSDVFMSGSGVRVLLVLGIVFCEFVIIFASLFDGILDTFKLILKPLLTMVPLGTFLYSTYRTFEPILFNLLPVGGGSGDLIKIAEVVNKPEFDNRVLTTIGAMLFYIVMTKVLGGDSAEVKSLKAELKKLRKFQSG
jgi:hypothetical protein